MFVNSLFRHEWFLRSRCALPRRSCVRACDGGTGAWGLVRPTQGNLLYDASPIMSADTSPIVDRIVSSR